jgi:hypothetical protein
MLFTLVISIIPQTALAFTYQSSNHRTETDSGDSSWIFIPIIILAIGFIVMIYYQRIKTKKDAWNGDQTEINVSSVVQDKLLPNEKPIRKLTNKHSDFVATNKRLLRFSAGRFEPIDYNNISTVSYKTSRGRKIATRVIIGFCMIMMLWITLAIWAALFDSSVTNVSLTDVIIITLVCSGIWVVGIMAASQDFGYYQIESKVYNQTNLKSWQIIRPPWYFGNINVDEFIKTVKKQITT